MTTSTSKNKQHPLWKPLWHHILIQHQCLDLITHQCRSQYIASGGTIYCDNGCGSCCTLHVHCLHTEAMLIAQHIEPLQAQNLDNYAKALLKLANNSNDLKTFLRHSRSQLDKCPFLSASGSCQIYSWRPLACRALLSTKEPQYCALDFSTLTSAQKQEFMASLDHNVVNFPTHYLAEPQELGAAAEQQHLQELINNFGIALSGNLPYLVYLEHRHQLSKLLETGAAATINYLNQNHLNAPFLLQVTTT